MGLSDLPDASGLEHKKTFEKFGWVVRREAEHIIMTHPNRENCMISIPNHKVVKRSTLKAILRVAQIPDKVYRLFFDS
jgi:predicted RNA binding protein YcfA (HicA-like mRNA interferase family)